MDNVINFFKGIGEGAINFFKSIFEPAIEVGGAVVDGVTKVKDFLINAFVTIYDLVEIFPIECRVLLLTFLTVASAYLIYKLVRGG